MTVNFTLAAIVLVAISFVGWKLAYQFYLENRDLEAENNKLKEEISEFPDRDKNGRFTKRK